MGLLHITCFEADMFLKYYVSSILEREMFCTETGGTSSFFIKTNIPHVLRSPVTSSGPKLTGTHQCSGFSSCNPRCGHPSTAMSLLIACQSKRVTSFSLMMDPCWCYQCYCSHYFNSLIICWNYGDDINYTVSRGH